MTRPMLYVAALLLFSLGAQPFAIAQTKYQNADEAWRVGVAYYNSRNYAATQEPLEAALKLAPNDTFRTKVYDALIPAYRTLPDLKKLFQASEFVIEHSDQAAKQSITRRGLIGFTFQRGKINELVSRQEKRLKKNKKDRTSLYILAEIYSRAIPDPQKAITYTNRLAKLDGKKGEPVSVRLSASLAQQHVRAKQYQKGAELYEKIAPLDEALAAWHWKEAASAWLRQGEKQKALVAAKKSHESAPEKRSDLLTHFWHKALADVFLATDQAKLAVEHYEKSIETTNIEGYIKSSKLGLADAKAKL